MEGLKRKALNGAKWSLLDRTINTGFEFSVGLILARLLAPSDFGTVAIISVIISFSAIFVNSGFSQSLQRDPDVGDKDFSTIFIFNLVIGVVFYSVIFFLSSHIANFYQNTDLTLYLKILGLSIFISSFTLVQRVNLIKSMNFKLISKINIISTLSSGFLALGMALKGFGIWSLIAKTLSREIIQSSMFWVFNKWKPSPIFELTIIRKHLKFGLNFLFSAIIVQTYNNILALTIGKIYNLQSLGYYNRAQLFSSVVSENVGGVMTSVSYPALAKVQNEKEKFIRGVRLLLKQAFFVVGILTCLLFFSCNVLIDFFLGKQWQKAGEFLQYLSLVGFFALLSSILLNSIMVTGRSNVYLAFQVWNLVLNIISLTVGYFYGMETMLMLLIVLNVFSYLLVSHIFNGFFGYSIINQLNDYIGLMKVIMPIVLIGIVFSNFDNSLLLVVLMLVLQLITAFVLASLLKLEEFILIKNLVFQKYTS